VSGSLGRLEAGPTSDADVIVVLRDGAPAEARPRVMEAVWRALAPLGLPRPSPTGIFTVPVARDELLDAATVGRVVEAPAVFGKRIQLLLDARAVYGVEEHARLVRAVVERYAAGFVERAPGKEWAYLLNDLVRYFRSLCVECQWDFSPMNEGWYVRNAKLRHSRVVMYAGLLFLLGESSRAPAGKVEWLVPRLAQSPLERLASAYRAHGEPGFDVVAGAYDDFLSWASSPAGRAALASCVPASPAELAAPPAYTRLHAGSRRLIGELVRFVLARRGSWSERFFEYLLF
jgi:hypothetical protein